jgi:hypothetical protein
VVVAQFEVLFRSCHAGSDENHESILPENVSEKRCEPRTSRRDAVAQPARPTKSKSEFKLKVTCCYNLHNAQHEEQVHTSVHLHPSLKIMK